MNPAEIKTSEIRINRSVKKMYRDISGKSHPITDGVIDPELYCASKPRIMWILKEPWDGENSTGGGWSLNTLLKEKPVSHFSQATFHPIIYIAYGLYNKQPSYDEMPWVRNMPTAETILRSLAFINAKKLPGYTRGAIAREILESYQKGKSVIADQITSYAPEIVFGCSPHFPKILDDMDRDWRSRLGNVGSADYVWIGGRLFVHVYHPGQTQVSRKCYVEDVLLAVVQAMAQTG